MEIFKAIFIFVLICYPISISIEMLYHDFRDAFCQKEEPQTTNNTGKKIYTRSDGVLMPCAICHQTPDEVYDEQFHVFAFQCSCKKCNVSSGWHTSKILAEQYWDFRQQLQPVFDAEEKIKAM